MTTSELLRAAKQLLQTEGWIKGEYHTVNGYCLSGALRQSAQIPIDYPLATPDQINTVSRACITIGRILIENRYAMRPDIPVFNDLPTTTLRDVLDVLDKAIAAESETLEEKAKEPTTMETVESPEEELVLV